MEDNTRSTSHKKYADLERIFPEMESLLGNAQRPLLTDFDTPRLPLFFIVGCARSGSTLVHQYLANTGVFNYPTNLISRFYYAPYIGARIQQMLVDFDDKGEIFRKDETTDFSSKLGKTFGPKQPHEFWYFWKRFFAFSEIQQLTPTQWENVDWSTFKKEIHAFEATYQKPLVMKALNMNWHIADLIQKLPNIHFIYIKRETTFNAQSLLLAREKFFGNTNSWYSFKPPEYEEIKKLQPHEQVMEQVAVCNAAIKTGLSHLSQSQYTEMSYEEFCDHPHRLLEHLVEKCGFDFDLRDQTFKFDSSNHQNVPDILFTKLNAYKTRLSDSSQ